MCLNRLTATVPSKVLFFPDSGHTCISFPYPRLPRLHSSSSGQKLLPQYFSFSRCRKWRKTRIELWFFNRLINVVITNLGGIITIRRTCSGSTLCGHNLAAGMPTYCMNLGLTSLFYCNGQYPIVGFGTPYNLILTMPYRVWYFTGSAYCSLLTLRCCWQQLDVRVAVSGPFGHSNPGLACQSPLPYPKDKDFYSGLNFVFKRLFYYA